MLSNLTKITQPRKQQSLDCGRSDLRSQLLSQWMLLCLDWATAHSLPAQPRPPSAHIMRATLLFVMVHSDESGKSLAGVFLTLWSLKG